jgi:hypothetical protein
MKTTGILSIAGLDNMNWVKDTFWLQLGIAIALIVWACNGCGPPTPTTTCNIMRDLNDSGAFIGMTLDKQKQIQHKINARIDQDFHVGTASDYSCVY